MTRRTTMEVRSISMKLSAINRYETERATREHHNIYIQSSNLIVVQYNRLHWWLIYARHFNNAACKKTKNKNNN